MPRCFSVGKFQIRRETAKPAFSMPVLSLRRNGSASYHIVIPKEDGRYARILRDSWLKRLEFQRNN